MIISHNEMFVQNGMRQMIYAIHFSLHNRYSKKMVKYIDNHLSMAQGWHTDLRQENTGWKWPKFHITANCKITIAKFLTNHCIENMIFHEQLNISIKKSTNYFKITKLAHKVPYIPKMIENGNITSN